MANRETPLTYYKLCLQAQVPYVITWFVCSLTLFAPVVCKVRNGITLFYVAARVHTIHAAGCKVTKSANTLQPPHLIGLSRYELSPDELPTSSGRAPPKQPRRRHRGAGAVPPSKTPLPFPKAHPHSERHSDTLDAHSRPT